MTGLPREMAGSSRSAEARESGISHGIGPDTLRKVSSNASPSGKMKVEGKKERKPKQEKSRGGRRRKTKKKKVRTQ